MQPIPRLTTTHNYDDGREEFMVSPTPGSRSSSPVEVILLNTSSPGSDQSGPSSITDQTARSRPRSYMNSHSDSNDWSYQDDPRHDLDEQEEDSQSFFRILSRAFSSGSLSWQTLESLYGSGLRGASIGTWTPAEGRRRLRSDYRVNTRADVMPIPHQIERIPESPSTPKREETRKGFARSFELDIGGFIDSSSESEDDGGDDDGDRQDLEDRKANKEDKQDKNGEASAIHIDRDEDEEFVDVGPTPSVVPEVHSTQVDSYKSDRPSLTERFSSDDSIYIVEPDGVEHPLPPGPTPPSNRASSSSRTTMATVPKRTHYPVQSQGQKRRPPRIQQYGLSFGCSSCLRPLLQRASSPDRKIYVLSCGHLIDGYCLVRLCAHPDSIFPFIYPSTASDSPEGSSRDRKKPKSKVKPPKPPYTSRSYEWFCPVEGCERPHQSILDIFVDDQSGEVGMFLEGPQWCWRPLMGGAEGVRLLFI